MLNLELHYHNVKFWSLNFVLWNNCLLTLASVTLNSLRIYWGMLYSAMGSTTKYWYLADLSAGQYWWHFSCRGWKIEYHNEPQHSLHTLASLCSFPEFFHSFHSISPFWKLIFSLLNLCIYFSCVSHNLHAVCSPNKEVTVPKKEENKCMHTLPISLSLVSITTIVELCSQSILQKSSVVSASGPCVAM